MRKRIRVAHVATVPEFALHFILNELQSLQDRVDSTVVCADGPGVDQIRAHGFRVKCIPITRKVTPVRDCRTIAALGRIFLTESFDILHSYLPKGGLLGQLAGVATGISRRVHSCRGLLYSPSSTRGQRLLFRATDCATFRMASLTTFVSRADCEFAVAEGLCDSRTARFTGNGIDLARFDPARVEPGERERIRASLGLPQDAFVFLTVGRYVVEKGYMELASAAQALRQYSPRACFLWVSPILPGETGLVPEAMLRERGLDGVVVRTPWHADMPSVYSAADALVHPSYREGMPRVLIEAAAMGLPIAASNIPGCREAIEHGRTGLLFSVRDVHSLTDALRALIDDYATARLRAKRAALKTRADFDYRLVAERTWAVYQELLDA